MILVLEDKITNRQKSDIKALLDNEGCIVHEIVDAGRNIMGIIKKPGLDQEQLRNMPGVAGITPINT